MRVDKIFHTAQGNITADRPLREENVMHVTTARVRACALTELGHSNGGKSKTNHGQMKLIQYNKGFKRASHNTASLAESTDLLSSAKGRRDKPHP